MLHNFDLVNTDGLAGLNFQGDFIPLDKIDDALAATLEGKTHVLRRKVAAELAQLAEAVGAEAPAAVRKRSGS